MISDSTLQKQIFSDYVQPIEQWQRELVFPQMKGLNQTGVTKDWHMRINTQFSRKKPSIVFA